ncbi:MAG TPA: hypothetical protein VJ895_01175 [Candidatus Nanoarchaeia archaeon]|nr:hypothetical protein [Candidatus Nanoarchaeia archaeon]
MVEDIVGYVKSNLGRGLDPEMIKQNLLSQGHADYDIDKAFSEVNQENNSEVNEEDESESSD